MIKSMTGFGKSILEMDAKKLTVEIKSLNSKQLDINTRIAGPFREKELEIRAELSRAIERGKVDFSIYVDNNGDTAGMAINKPLVRKYYSDLRELANELNEPENLALLPVIARMPDIIKAEREELDETEWQQVNIAIHEALAQFDTFRLQEGALLEKDMVKRVALILKLLQEVEPFEKRRIMMLRERMMRNQAEYREANTNTEKFDENRFEQELFYFLEKLDITEEKVRLRKHCDYFGETLADPASNGRKLGFIMQEIGREINTLGSKANDADIQKIVVQMKDELEKIKEQLANIL
ncbi:MAG TPA: YicC/YloC family endoribonuclease [Bacteroidales bacterium]